MFSLIVNIKVQVMNVQIYRSQGIVFVDCNVQSIVCLTPQQTMELSKPNTGSMQTLTLPHSPKRYPPTIGGLVQGHLKSCLQHSHTSKVHFEYTKHNGTKRTVSLCVLMFSLLINLSANAILLLLVYSTTESLEVAANHSKGVLVQGHLSLSTLTDYADRSSLPAKQSN